jgi:hypothetical protein
VSDDFSPRQPRRDVTLTHAQRALSLALAGIACFGFCIVVPLETLRWSWEALLHCDTLDMRACATPSMR